MMAITSHAVTLSHQTAWALFAAGFCTDMEGQSHCTATAECGIKACLNMFFKTVNSS